MTDREEMFKPVTGSGGGARESRVNAAVWRVLMPVPADAPPPPVTHYRHGKPSATYPYRNATGELLGFIWRLETKPGEKEFVPLTWCERTSDGKREWRHKSWEVPRPLYGLDQFAKLPDAPVVVVEGEKAAEALAGAIASHAVLTSPGGSKAAGKADWRPVARRLVIIWPDNDEPGDKYAVDVARASLANGAAAVHIISVPSGKVKGWDAADAIAEGWTPDMIAKLLADAPAFDSSAVQEQPARPKIPQRDRVLEIFEGIELWHDESGEVYATLAVNSHSENWPLRSGQVRRWIRLRYNEATGATIGGQALEDAIGLMEARGAESGACFEPRRRVGRTASAIYVDLCDEKWRAIEVDHHGWRLVDRPPVKFLRSPPSRPLPEPEAGESIDLLRKYLNVATDDDFKLAVAWLVASLSPNGPYPLAIISGEQGSGKSNGSKVLRALVDPNAAPIRTPPKDERDLLVGAVHSHVQALDNLSSVPAWLADALCRLATGGGFATKTLYTDLSETVISAVRPSILNGIPNLSERADLADRAISLALAAIREDQRIPEGAFWQEFERDRPLILGALLDGVSAGLRNHGKVKLDKLPRMADFAIWVEQCASGLGWASGEFLAAYSANRADISAGAFEADPMASVIRDLMKSRPGGWEGSATALLDLVNDAAPETTRKSRFWPGSASAMGSRLKRIAPLLRREGIESIFTHSGVRTIRLVWLERPDGRHGPDQYGDFQ